MATPTEKEDFSYRIQLRIDGEKLKILDAIMDECEVVGLEVEVAATLLTDDLKARLAKEVAQVNLLKKEEPVKPAMKPVKKKVTKKSKKSKKK
jgi:hypothetical protein